MTRGRLAARLARREHAHGGRLASWHSITNLVIISWVFVACGDEDPQCRDERGEGAPLCVN
jgi:hypothetical protein